MEPNGSQNPNPSSGPSNNEDLHEEGIDIVGSSMALNNEYSNPENEDRSAPAAMEAEEPAPIAPVAQAPEKIVAAPAPIPKAQAAPEISRAAPTAPIEPPKPAPRNDPSIKPIRTFKTDAEEAVRYGGVSKIDMAVAEQRKKEANSPITYETEHRSHRLLIAIVIALILVLSGGWYFWFTSTQGTTNRPVQAEPTIKVSEPISYNKAALVVLDPSTDPFSLFASKLKAANLSIGQTYALVPVDTSTSTRQAPVSEALSGTHAPNSLVRSLSDTYMVGIYAYATQSPFIILKDTFFDNAFAGMLAWEKNLGSDLAPLIHIAYPAEDVNSFDNNNFTDTVVSNVDARILSDSSGQVVLAYAFADKDTIVIATDTATLKYILDKILQVQTVQ